MGGGQVYYMHPLGEIARGNSPYGPLFSTYLPKIHKLKFEANVITRGWGVKSKDINSSQF